MDKILIFLISLSFSNLIIMELLGVSEEPLQFKKTSLNQDTWLNFSFERVSELCSCQSLNAAVNHPVLSSLPGSLRTCEATWLFTFICCNLSWGYVIKPNECFCRYSSDCETLISNSGSCFKDLVCPQNQPFFTLFISYCNILEVVLVAVYMQPLAMLWPLV